MTVVETTGKTVVKYVGKYKVAENAVECEIMIDTGTVFNKEEIKWITQDELILIYFGNKKANLSGSRKRRISRLRIKCT